MQKNMGSNEERTLYVGNLSERVTEDLIYELFLQAGPLESVKIPVLNGRRRPYGFVEFKHEISVTYAATLFNQTCLFGRTLNLQIKRPVRSCPPRNMEGMTMPLNQLMSRLGPPILGCDYLPSTIPRTPKTVPSANQLPLPSKQPNPLQRNHNLPNNRQPSHLMPSKAKKRSYEELIDRNNIPNSLDFHDLVSTEDKVVDNKHKSTNERKGSQPFAEEDLRTKIKKKKKKKNKEHSSKKPAGEGEAERGPTTVPGGHGRSSGFEFNCPPKSYLKNAVNHLRQHYSRNNRGSYDLNQSNRKNKHSNHIRFDP